MRASRSGGRPLGTLGNNRVSGQGRRCQVRAARVKSGQVWSGARRIELGSVMPAIDGSALVGNISGALLSLTSIPLSWLGIFPLSPSLHPPAASMWLAICPGGA